MPAVNDYFGSRSLFDSLSYWSSGRQFVGTCRPYPSVLSSYSFESLSQLKVGIGEECPRISARGASLGLFFFGLDIATRLIP